MNTIDILFSLLRSAVKGETLSCGIEKLINEKELSELFVLSEKHDLAHIIGLALSQNGLLDDGETSKKFKKQIMLAMYRYEVKLAEIISISELFESERLEFLQLKGQTIARYYPEPWMRTSCDIDILVSEDEVGRAKTLLCEKLGYEVKALGRYDVSLFAPSGIHLELHFKLKNAFTKTEVCLEDLRKYMVENAEERFALSFTDEYLLFYAASHAAKHLAKSGCGIRQIIDLWFIEKNLEISEDVLKSYLDEVSMTTFLDGVRMLNEVWLEGREHTMFTRKMENFILDSGSYGTRENSVAIGKKSAGSQVAYILRRIFVPLETLKGSYPILEKYPCLVPVMLVRKWFFTLSPKRFRRAVGDLKRSAGVPSEKADAITDVLKELGL